jgi:peptide/nickel transport system permease protein
MISDGVVPTLSLAIPAFLITTIVSLLIGLAVAYYRGKMIDKIAVVICVIGMSVPALGYILFGQYIMAYKLDLFPISGYDASWMERWKYVVLPMIIWVFLSVGYEVRFYRTAFLEEVNQDYVRTARAKGLSESYVYLKHVLKNTMIPIITNVILEIPLLLLGAFLLESFFGIPGLGGITIGAIQNSDLPVIKAMTIFVSVLYVMGTLMTDIAYSLVDPRVRLK